MGIETIIGTNKTPFSFEDENSVKTKKHFENGTKRPLEDALPVSINCKPGKLCQIVSGRNPISILNELFTAPHSLMYEVQSVTGPAHCPLFVVSLKIKNLPSEYQGEGPSKKMAKTKAALHAISSISDLEATEDRDDCTIDKSEMILAQVRKILEKNEVDLSDKGNRYWRCIGLGMDLWSLEEKEITFV